jgi:hypothetical protein
VLLALLAASGRLAFSDNLNLPTAAAVSEASMLDSSLTPDAWETTPGAIDPQVFSLALQATRCAVQTGDIAAPPPTLTVIDYAQPSSVERLWVFDLRRHALLYRELVAHGRGSGDNWATHFSNEPETHSSSLGLFVADDTYVGQNGYSLRLNGLEAGINDRARERAIVMHGARYVSTTVVQQLGRLGRSWGCPALRAPVAREIIDRLKGGGVVFAYYPDRQWLRASKYLGGCDAAATSAAASLR